MGALAELKRRRVFRVALVYAGVAWGTAQVADVLEPVMGLPEWAVSFVLFVMVLGFPVAMVLAWAYDVEPGGIVRTQPEHRIGVAGKLGYLFLLLLGTALLIWLLTSRWTTVAFPVGGHPHTVEGARPVPQLDSIVVLPFRDLGADGADAYLGDGIAEELILSLSRVPDLRVAARTSAFAFRNREVTVQEIGQELSVGSVLEGTVRREGDRVIVTASLVDASSGFSVWTDSYDRAGAEVHDLQGDIALDILTAIRRDLDPVIREGLTEYLDVPSDAEAYEFYLRARYLWAQRSLDPAGVAMLEESVNFYREALKRDDQLVTAWSGMAAALYALGRRAGPVNNLDEEAVAAARQALVLDGGNGEAEGVLALERLDDRDWEAALTGLRQAVELRPGNADLRWWLAGTLNLMGYLEAAREQLEKAVRLDPLSSVLAGGLGAVYLDEGLDDQARRHLNRALQLHGGDLLVGIGYLRLKEFDKGAEVLRNARLPFINEQALDDVLAGLVDPAARPAAIAAARDRFDGPASLFFLLELKAWDDAIARAEGLAAQDRALGHMRGMFGLWDPDHAEFRRDPRFSDVAEQLGLLAHWRANGAPDRCEFADDVLVCDGG